MSTWLITGASSGIGRAVAAKVLANGDRVAAFVRDPRALDELAAGYPNHLWTAQVDVTDTNELRLATERAFAELGHIDVLFSNAGSGAFGAAEELDDAVIEQQIALNMVAPIQLIRAALPHLRAQGGGRIIQMSTMGGQLATTGGSMYHASKWGIEGFTESLMGEVAAFGIAVTLIEPGNVRTPFGAALSVAAPLSAYAETPVGQVRQYIEAAGGNLTANAPGDPDLIADAIISVATQTPAPRRLVLGSDAFNGIRAALVSRLTELDQAAAVSASTDFPAGA
ncbi:SDR family oxidoreductase [Agreia sp. Leaf283]|uniref:SDR family oxidoreductase n=1 Tax=Agreia sp. Leaf283 TaxID=1736321 RepID=UPI0006FFF99C|nr:SDR family oxidoreductase [Agreia sp. Leaf283]KQP56103.1 short-chain dehydrogenase [Agreia sp. Leaf283]